MKTGNKLYCYKEISRFKVGYYYEIVRFDNQKQFVKIAFEELSDAQKKFLDASGLWFTLSSSYLYYRDYFYTEKHLREIKIKRIEKNNNIQDREDI